MAVPSQQQLHRPILEIVVGARDHVVPLQEVKDALIRQFSLDDRDLAEKVPSGQSRFVTRVYWAVSYLRRAGMLESPSRARFRITQHGCQTLETHEGDIELLDVVRPLSIFAAQLPEYTRRIANLPDPAKNVHDALLTAREPATLVFEALPVACGFDPFPIDGSVNDGRERRFVAVLQDIILSLRATYPQLLERIRHQIMLGLGDGSVCPDRAQVTQRASRMVLAAVERRLQTFARCLADLELTNDSWAERIATFVASKPPAQWTAADEIRAISEIDILTAVFCRVETTVFDGDNSDPHIDAIRLGLTRGDGSEYAKVVRFPKKQEATIQELAAGVEGVLAEASGLKLAAMSRALWNMLGAGERVDERSSKAESQAAGDSTEGLP